MSARGETCDGGLHIKTPLIHSFPFSTITGCNVYLKMDNMQPSSSFKIRGIGHAIKKEKEKGCQRIIGSSGGNAGVACAYACRKLNVPITLFVPETTEDKVIERLKAEGAEVIVHGAAFDHANERAKEEAQKPGCVMIHPFDNADVWEGHTSIVKEIREDLTVIPDLLVLSVGGGGLLAGVVQGMEEIGWNDVPILTMETIGADSFNKAVVANKLVTLPAITSVAKCLGALTVCQQAFDCYQKRPIISEVISDAQCISALLKFLDDHRTLVEPACAASLAAVYSGVISKLQKEGKLGELKNIVIIVCGGYGVSLDSLLAWKDKFCPA